jgi:hypothetical protein
MSPCSESAKKWVLKMILALEIAGFAPIISPDFCELPIFDPKKQPFCLGHFSGEVQKTGDNTHTYTHTHIYIYITDSLLIIFGS